MVQVAGTEKEILDSYCRSLRENFPEDVAEIILFGSRARGKGRSDSDIDLLIVLNTQDPHVKREVLDLAWEAMSRHNFKAFLSPIVFFKKDYHRYRQWNSSFLENVSQDAVRL